MAEVVTVGLLVAAGAATSAEQARAQRSQVRRTASAAKTAAELQAEQIQRAGGLERKKVLDRQHLITSRARVAMGESGFAIGNTFEAILRQADLDAQTDVNIIMQNATAGVRGALSRVPPTPPTLNPLVAGFLGALGGASSGLQIGQDISAIGAGRTPRTAVTTGTSTTGTPQRLPTRGLRGS